MGKRMRRLVVWLILSAGCLTPFAAAQEAFGEAVEILSERPAPRVSAPVPPATGSHPALQGMNTAFGQRAFRVALSENDLGFSDKGLSQYSELLYAHPLNESTTLNTSLELAMYTPPLKRVTGELGNGENDVYHYPLYAEGQLVRTEPFASATRLRLVTQVQVGVDAPREVGGFVHNNWHRLINDPTFAQTGEARFYGGVGGSVLLEGGGWGVRYALGPSAELTTLQRSAGVVGKLEYSTGRFASQLFASGERVRSRLYSPAFETGNRVEAGLSAAYMFGAPSSKTDWQFSAGFTFLFDYNSVVPELSNFRYTVVPSLQLSLPIK